MTLKSAPFTQLTTMETDSHETAEKLVSIPVPSLRGELVNASSIL